MTLQNECFYSIFFPNISMVHEVQKKYLKMYKCKDKNKDTLFVKYVKNVSSITHILAALSIVPQKAGQAYQCWPLN